MTRYALIAALLGTLGLAGALLWTLQANADLQAERDALRGALSHAEAYIQTTKGVRHATDNLPDDPDAVLAELCRLAGGHTAAGGEGCSDP